MNRDQTIGMVLIGIIFVGYILYTQPSKEEIEAARERRDSVARVEMLEQQKIIEQQAITQLNQSADTLLSDSLNLANLNNQFGKFATSAQGEEKYYIIENELVELKIAAKGGYVYSARLKEFQTHDSLPLILFDGDSTLFGFSFTTTDRLVINTQKMFFESSSDKERIQITDQPKSLSMKLKAGENQYVEYLYTLKPGDYMIDFSINFVNMGDIIPGNVRYFDLIWSAYIPSQEKGWSFENDYTCIYYKATDDDVEYLTERSDFEEENISTDAKWIAFKQQFFSTVLIADQAFQGASLKQTKLQDKSEHLKSMVSEIGLPYAGTGNEKIAMKFYFGPNHYNTLDQYDLKLEKMIPLGWGIFGWINRFAVIPLFNFLGSFIVNYGIVILLLTIIIKLALFPFTYRSYLSTAKMRVLRPQIDELTKDIPKEKAMERQQKSMEIYRKAGVNPMGGCLPMLLQMPILIAMFRFFPASIELRQKPFLWANDLSSYDAIVSWTTEIPFLSSIYGNHISLFTLLMTISTIIYTRMNQNQMGDANSQMPGMKTIMYLFPVMMLFWFNNYASGLSYYYLLANVITFGQMYIMKRFVNEDEILAKLEANKKKPVKKSSFQERLEKMAKERGVQLPKR